MVEPELVNVVGGGDIGVELDLQQLYQALEGEEVRYDPEYWSGLYLQYNADSPAVLIFRTGKYNMAGADSVQQLMEVNDRFISDLQKIGISEQESSFEVRNLVFLDQYDRELNLEKLVVALGLEDAEYEPEQFPGVQFQPPDIIGTFLIFRTGKVILTGAKSVEDATDAFSEFFELMDDIFASS